ncbi:MAG TPA: PrsW family glutamic-type intramembrane protease [Phycisphaerae bacterium]|nr:PrsW family glutamic-type intramembrane protease [Phycisphaerae bacterium]
MSIDFTCACGKTLHAPDGAGGKKARCPKCQAVVRVPEVEIGLEGGEYDLHDPLPTPVARAAAAPPPPPISKAPPAPVAVLPALSPAAVQRVSPVRRFTYLLLLLALIPLILSTFHRSEDSSDIIVRSIEAHPEVAAQFAALLEHREEIGGEITEDDALDLLPGHRTDDALISHDSHAHWLMALGTGVLFFAFLLLAFQRAAKYFKGLLFAGIFTATVGIVLLLVFQFAAYSLPFIIPRGIIGLIILIVKFIGLSYRLADDPNNGFLLSFVGFTCGVGLCEEITKAIPLLLRIKPAPGVDDPTWNSLLLWGLASGFGFGIAEGIMYSGRYYNGIYGADIYLIRFLSCVALHAIWSGSAGIMMYRHQGDILGVDSNWGYWARVIQVVWVPMVLHGLYDTLLKKEMNALALVVALASFGWLAFLIERQHGREPLGSAAASAV